MAQENDIIEAAKQICEEKNISFESVVQTIEAALAVAYRKDFGEKNQNIKVEFDIKTGKSRVFDEKTVVADEKYELTEKLKAEKLAQEEAEAASKQEVKDKKGKSEPEEPKEEKSEKDEGEGDSDEEKFERFNPKTEITLTEAKKINKGAKEGEVIRTELFPPAAYGRMAAQTAKQVIIQRLREAERDTIYKEFKDKEGEVINGTVQRIEGRMVLIDLGHTTALLPPSEQIPHERYNSGQRLKFFVISVNTTPRGPEIILSRSHPDMVKKLFFLEVPEIGNGSVEIKSIAREAGSRTKIAVATSQKNIDPVGSCVGQRGSRVQTIISEIGGEKIDIIEWDDDSVKFIINSLSPAKVLSVKLNEAEKVAVAEVKDDQLSLAIGKAGQNVRLSAKLTGWKIDIISESGQKAGQGNGHKKAESGETKPAADSDNKEKSVQKGKAEDRIEAAGGKLREQEQQQPEDQKEKDEDKEAETDNKEKAEKSEKE